MDTLRARLVAGLLVFGLLCTSVSAYLFHRGIRDRNQLTVAVEEARQLREQTRLMRGQVEQLRAEIDRNADILQTREQQLARAEQARLEIERERLERAVKEQSRAEKQEQVRERISLLLRADEGSVLRDGSRLTIRLSNQVLFESGEANIREEGRAVLTAVGELLRTELAGLDILVEGHTDNVAIGEALRLRFGGNWELSASRASAAVEYLIHEASIDAARLTVIGRADTRPLAPNDTPEGRALNRRIDMVLDLESLGSTDAMAGPPAP